jgi:hypothetical protein
LLARNEYNQPVFYGESERIQKMNEMFKADISDVTLEGFEYLQSAYDSREGYVYDDAQRGRLGGYAEKWEESYRINQYISFVTAGVWDGLGPHGGIESMGYTFDCETGSELKISDILLVDKSQAQETLYNEYIAYQMGRGNDGKHLAEAAKGYEYGSNHYNKYYVESVKTQCNPATVVFWLADDGVHIYFNQYTFNYATGASELVIPYSRSDLVRAPFAVQPEPTPYFEPKPTATPEIQIDIDKIDREAVSDFIQNYVFPPEGREPVSTDKDFVDAVLDKLWSEQDDLPEPDGSRYIPVKTVDEALRRVYGIESANLDDQYRYRPDDGAYYNNLATVLSLTDNGDGTFTAIAEVRYGSYNIDDSFSVTYPELAVALKLTDSGFQLVSINDYKIPKNLFNLPTTTSTSTTPLATEYRVNISDVEGEVSRIRELWTDDRSAISNGEYLMTSVDTGITAFWNGGNLKMIEVVSGTNDIAYSRIYEYENNTLIFAYWEGEDAHRLYFTNGYQFRWRHTLASGEYVDYDNAYNNAGFLERERTALTESNRLYLQATVD